MKNRQRIISMMFIIITLLAYLPTFAFAKTSYKNITFNKWFSLNEKTAKNTVYKIKLTSDSVITIEYKNKDDRSDRYDFDIFNDIECDDDIDVYGDIIVLTKGTYYLKARNRGSSVSSWGTSTVSTENCTVRFKKKSVKSINKSNTSPEKAITLKPNKEIELAFTRNDAKARWYKISLTKTKKIFIYSNRSINFELYDNNANRIDSDMYWTGDKGRTFKKYKKGNYYITINANLPFAEEGGSYCKLYWR